jgi:hypothetical protein
MSTTVPLDIPVIVDHISIAPNGDKIMVTVTLTLEFDAASALDLGMKLTGAVARAQGLDDG